MKGEVEEISKGWKQNRETLERTPNIGVIKKEITEVIEENKLSRKDIRIFISRVVHAAP